MDLLDKVKLLHVYALHIADLDLGVDLRVVVSDEELDELVFFNFLALDPDSFEAGLDGTQAFVVSFLHRFCSAALLADGGDGLLGGNGGPKAPEDPYHSGLADASLLVVIEGDDDIEVLFHDLRHVDQVCEEVDIAIGLLLEERILLLDGEVLEFVNVPLDIDLE